MADQHTMQDPTAQYPKMNIPEQSQPEPGLDAELQPKADHGADTYKGSGRLTGRKALITGGDSGIGRAVAIAFAREGADVAIAYLPAEQKDADAVVAEIEKCGQKAVALPGDLVEEAACRTLVTDTIEALGGIDILVNNAGKQVYNDDFLTLDPQQVRDTYAVNVLALFWITQEALKSMPKGASIINTTSIQATQPSPGLIDYASTKAAILNITRGLSQQLTPKGIRVNAVAPGPVWTPLQPSHGQSQEKLTKFGQNTPMGRAGQPAELAAVYVFLASQESSYISGETIGVTGGELR